MLSRLAMGILASLLAGNAIAASAQPGMPAPTAIHTSGTFVVVPAFGEVTHPNDEARVTLMVEEQDKDKAVAASRVNQKMKQGAELVRREDLQASLRTRGYYSYPVYADDAVQPRQSNRVRQLVGWRVGQYLEVTTTNLPGLPKTVAAVQGILALNGLQFGLAPKTQKKLEEQRIAAAYGNLVERIGAIAKAMGRSASDAVLDTVDFEGSSAYAPSADAQVMKTMRVAPTEGVQVEEPSFEPGETTLNMRVVGKIRFK